MSSDVLLAQYRRQPVVADRNSSTLLRWAAYISAQGIPATKPDEETARKIILAARLPEQIDSYTQRTLSFFLQDPGVTQNVNPWLNAFNTPDMEDQLSNQNDAILAGFVDRFAETDVSDQQVADWYAANFPATPASAGAARRK